MMQESGSDDGFLPLKSEPVALRLVDEEEIVARSKSRLQSFRFMADLS